MQDGGAAPVEPDWDKLPIEERLAAKVSVQSIEAPGQQAGESESCS